MRTRTQLLHRSLPEQEEQDEAAPRPGDVVLEMPSPVQALRNVATKTAPDWNAGFVLAFLALTYFHETHFEATAAVLGVWCALQVVVYALDEDFRNDLFWNIFSLLGYVAFYLFCGSLVSMGKLYLDVRFSHLDPHLIARIRSCVTTEGETGCVVPLLFDMKWMLVRWMTTWPITVVHTLSRDPLRIVTDLIFQWTRQRYFWIMSSAIRALDNQDSTEPTSWTEVAVGTGYLVGYLAIGYAWTHVKLFLEVWQGSLPASLDAQVRDVYNRKASYWEFVASIKWLVTQWMITWPLSVVYTILRHPLRIVADFIYQLSHRKYMWIVGKAMDARMKKDQ